jgi:hypoxanthine-guanine phosphoribosyltransferase
VVVLSSYEAEYIATSTTTTQALWLSKLLAELLGRHVEVVELKVDSKSALALAKNLVFHERSKHIRIKCHFIRSCLEDESIKAEYISTTNQLADILTKSLGKTKFEEMRGRIGLKQIIPKAHKAKGEN